MDSTRVSVIEGLKAGNREAWGRFALIYQEKIRLWVFQYCRAKGLAVEKSREVADDVSQEILMGIQRKVQSFDPASRQRGSFRKWLKVTTINELRNYLRDNVKKWGSGDSAILRRLDEELVRTNLEAEIDKEIEQHVYNDALEELRAASPREFAMIDDLGWGDGRSKKDSTGPTPKEVAQRHGTTVSTLLKTKSRLKKSLKIIASRRREEFD